MTFRRPVALQEHADDDLQVDGPGETDTEADAADEPAPVRPKQLVKTVPAESSADQDTAQIAKKIKDLIHLKGTAPKPAAIKEDLPASEPTTPVDEIQRSESGDCISVRSASQGSLSGKTFLSVPPHQLVIN